MDSRQQVSTIYVNWQIFINLFSTIVMFFVSQGDPARLASKLNWSSTPPSLSPTAIYTSETWKSTARIRQQLDVFHQRNLRKILGITWKDHVTNMEVLSQTGQRRLQDIVAERRLRMAGHIIRMPPGRPANHAMSWTPRASDRWRGRPTKTWRSTFKEDLVDREVDWNSVRAVDTNRSRRRTLAAHCPVKDRRI